MAFKCFWILNISIHICIYTRLHTYLLYTMITHTLHMFYEYVYIQDIDSLMRPDSNTFCLPPFHAGN